ncbi:MAG: hypothetical protein SPL03_03065 [Succinivibrio dextrinosolvens]|nr:hypothetical protein [Succinivibrio dextrinosolvens]
MVRQEDPYIPPAKWCVRLVAIEGKKGAQNASNSPYLGSKKPKRTYDLG